MEKWKKLFENNPNFQFRLADYYRDRDPKTALKLYQTLVNDNPSTYPYVRALAAFYKKNGERKKWKNTLTAFLNQPDSGLTHANIRNKIAKDHLRRMEYKEAVPYAERAAKSWAAWALATASEANEWAGNHERAEFWVRRISERYSGSHSNWYFWCQRTGRGDLAAARKLSQRKILAVGAKSKVQRRLWESRDFYLLGEDYKTAISFVKQQVNLAPNNPYNRMFLAFLYGIEKKKKEREANLQAVVDGFDKKPGHQDRGFYETAKQALGWFTGKSAVDPKAIHTALSEQDITLGAKGHFFIALFAFQAGKPDAARADLVSSAQKGDQFHSLTVYSWQTLRIMKLDPAVLLNERKRTALAKEKNIENKAVQIEDDVF